MSIDNDGIPDIAEPKPLPGWPKVVGIISIVWGALGVTCLGCFFGMSQFLPALMGKPDEPLPPTLKPDPLQMGVYILGAIMALVLLIAGVLTVKRRPVGKWLHLAYAAVSLLVLPVSLYLGYQKN